MKDKKEKEKRRYIFPSKVAKKMKEIDTRTQLESTMLSTFLIIVGMFLFMVHQLLYGTGTALFKGMLIFNLLCGVVLLSSSLVTSYQQYVNHLEIMGIDPDEEKKQIKAQGNIFKRIIKALRKKKKGKEYLSTLKEKYSPEDLENLYKVQMLDNMEYSEEILKNQGKVKFKIEDDLKTKQIPMENVQEVVPEKSPLLMKNKAKNKVHALELAEEIINKQREMIEQ